MAIGPSDRPRGGHRARREHNARRPRRRGLPQQDSKKSRVGKTKVQPGRGYVHEGRGECHVYGGR